MKNKKIVYRLIAIVIFLIIGVGLYAYREYNRKNVDLADSKAAFTLTEMQLINDFSQDQEASNKKYLGKILELSGNIKKIDTDANGYHTVILGNAVNMNSVRCSVDSAFNKEAHNLTVGSSVVIKGICTGYNADDLGLGSDVILNRSIAIKK
jgi:acetyltransferase-like isoleucine patch superfamily enzyme